MVPGSSSSSDQPRGFPACPSDGWVEGSVLVLVRNRHRTDGTGKSSDGSRGAFPRWKRTRQTRTTETSTTAISHVYPSKLRPQGNPVPPLAGDDQSIPADLFRNQMN